ncbi:hypothetical protein ACSNOD_30860, partial [Streptomyces sp. URMC 123]
MLVLVGAVALAAVLPLAAAATVKPARDAAEPKAAAKGGARGAGGPATPARRDADREGPPPGHR